MSNLEAIDRIKRAIATETQDAEPQDAANILGEIQSDIEATLESIKEDFDVEPQ